MPQLNSNDEILQLNQRLLDAIAAADWATYEELCDPALTAFEPEARGHCVVGLDFHRFYFDLGAPTQARHTTMVDPRVTLLGDDAALLTYVRLVQAQTERGPITQLSEETRVWQRQDGRWRHIHFHRSDNGSH
jgi:ketosteroid isomerase-like protein